MKKLFIIFLITNISLIAQQDILVKFNKDHITKQEFSNRYELTPKITSGKNTDSLKTDFLYSIIAEKLWAEEAKSELLDTTEYYRSSIKFIEKLLVRDALYTKEIKSKVKVTNDQIKDGLIKYSRNLKTRYINTQNETSAEKLYNLLKNGAPFDSLCSSTDGNEYFCDTLSIHFGKMQLPLENILYSLHQGQISQPINSPIGWLTFKIDEIYTNPEISGLTQADAARKVQKIIAEREEDEIGLQFNRKFFKNVEVTVDVGEFLKLSALMQNELFINEKDPNGKFFLSPEMYANVRRAFSSKELHSNYVKFKKDPVSLYDFLTELESSDLKFADTTLTNLRANLDAYQKDFIRTELLAREGYKRGMEKLPEVKNELKQWSDFFLANAYRHQFNKSVKVNPEEVEELISGLEDKGETLYKIHYLDTPDLSIIELVLKRMSAGEDFDIILKDFNESFETDFIDKTQLGDKTDIIENMNIGEVFGPVRLGNNYSIIKLLDKKKGTFVSNDNPTKYKEIENMLFVEKLKKKLGAATSDLALKYGMKINNNIFKAIFPTEVNMVVFRYYGFGGKTSAVPIGNNFSEWIKIYKKKTGLNLP